MAEGKDHIQQCIEKLRASADYGDGDLDKNVHEAATATHAPCHLTGLPSWERDGKERGIADWVVPHDMKDETTRILYIHGGNFEYYSPQDVYRPLTTRVAVGSGLPVFAIDHRKSPEHPFPAATEDAVHAAHWLMENGPSGPSKATSIILMGDSSGGNLVLSTLIALQRPEFQQEGVQVKVGGAVTISAYTDLLHKSDTYKTRMWQPETGKGDPVFSNGDDEQSLRDSSVDATQTYVKDNSRDDPLVSPMHASKEELSNLPPLLMMVGDAEVMLGDTRDLAARIKAAGGVVTLSVYDRMWHVWVMYADGCGTRQNLKPALDGIDEMSQFCAGISKQPTE